MLDAIGGRKFLLTLLVLGVGTAVQILSPKGVTTEYTALLLGVVATFHGANALITTKMGASQSGDDDADASAPAIDLSPLQAQIEAQGKAIMSMSEHMHKSHETMQAHAQVIEGMQSTLDLTQKLAKAAVAIKQ